MTDSQLLSQKKGTFCLDIDVKKSGFDIAGNNVMGACRRVYACLSCMIMHTIQRTCKTKLNVNWLIRLFNCVDGVHVNIMSND